MDNQKPPRVRGGHPRCSASSVAKNPELGGEARLLAYGFRPTPESSHPLQPAACESPGDSDISGFVADYSGATASDSHGLPFAFPPLFQRTATTLPQRSGLSTNPDTNSTHIVSSWQSRRAPVRCSRRSFDRQTVARTVWQPGATSHEIPVSAAGRVIAAASGRPEGEGQSRVL